MTAKGTEEPAAMLRFLTLYMLTLLINDSISRSDQTSRLVSISVRRS